MKDMEKIAKELIDAKTTKEFFEIGRNYELDGFVGLPPEVEMHLNELMVNNPWSGDFNIPDGDIDIGEFLK